MEKIRWNAPEYIYSEKTIDWYWIVGIVSISASIIAIILDNTIFGILIIISTFTLMLYATKKPEVIPVEINHRGIKVKSTLYQFADLQSFWVETRDNYPRLFLRPKKTLSIHIVIMLDDVDAEKIREVLDVHLPEEEQTEPFLEKVLLYLGF